MKQYIIATKKHPFAGNSVSEILEYGLYTGKDANGKNQYKPYTKQYFFDYIFKETDHYESFNPENSDTAELYRNDRIPGKPFLQSKATNTVTDNLLKLPDIQ